MLQESGVAMAQVPFSGEFGRNVAYYTGFVFEVMAPSLGPAQPRRRRRALRRPAEGGRRAARRPRGRRARSTPSVCSPPCAGAGDERSPGIRRALEGPAHGADGGVPGRGRTEVAQGRPRSRLSRRDRRPRQRRRGVRLGLGDRRRAQPRTRALGRHRRGPRAREHLQCVGARRFLEGAGVRPRRRRRRGAAAAGSTSSRWPIWRRRPPPSGASMGARSAWRPST